MKTAAMRELEAITEEAFQRALENLIECPKHSLDSKDMYVEQYSF